MNKSGALFILIIILATVAAYANSLHNQFVWDDEDWILKNSTIKNPQEWSKLFTENSIQGARKGSNFYRPLQAITHGIDYLLWGYGLPGHHATNIAFHALVAIVLFLLLGRVFSQNMAFLAALFFAIHPVHTEAVTYVSGRADPMAVLFMLLTVLLFEKNIFLACGAFILGILSKESALIAPLLICVYLAARDKKIDYKKFTPFIFIIIVYAALRLTILNFTGTIPENAPKAFFYVPFYIRLSTFLKTLPVYFKVLLWPFGLHMERDIALSYSVFEPQSLLGLLTTGSLFFFGFRFRKSHKFLLFSAAWFFICIFPNSNLFPINALLYEHWLYLPSIGFFVIVAWVINRLLGKRQFKLIAVLLALCLAGFYAWRTFERNKDWHDPISFYESTIIHKPDSARLHNNLAMAYVDAGRNDDAIREYKKAIGSGDYYAQPHYNISNIYLNRGDYASAVKELKISIEIDNNFLYSHESLALIYFNQNNFEQAKKEAIFIIEREPQNKIAREILSKIPYLTK